MKDTLDEIIADIHSVHGKFEDLAKTRSWLFEYACQTCETEGYNPVSVPAYVNWLMRNKLTSIYTSLKYNYQKEKRNSFHLIRNFRIEDIPRIVAYEHKKK